MDAAMLQSLYKLKEHLSLSSAKYRLTTTEYAIDFVKSHNNLNDNYRNESKLKHMLVEVYNLDDVHRTEDIAKLLKTTYVDVFNKLNMSDELKEFLEERNNIKIRLQKDIDK